MMAHRKEPKPYTLKSRRGERPYSYSAEYAAWRNAVTDPRRNAEDLRQLTHAWAVKHSPSRRILA